MKRITRALGGGLGFVLAMTVPVEATDKLKFDAMIRKFASDK